jgi:hypothetical protein
VPGCGIDEEAARSAGYGAGGRLKTSFQQSAVSLQPAPG